MKTRLLIGMLLLMATGILAQQADPILTDKKKEAMQKMNLETPGQWQEFGEYSPDQKTWYKYLEMNLTRDN